MSNGSNSMNNLHAGHRQRMWEKYRINGLKMFSEHEMLEILLYMMIPRVNTNEIAHNLINKFGSIDKVITTDPGLLKEIQGIGEHTALQLNFIGNLFSYIKLKKPERFMLKTSKDVIEYCENYFRDITCECFTYFLMDNDKNVIYYDDIFSDSEYETEFSLKKIMRQAIIYECSKILLAHNHPHGRPESSNADIAATRRIANLLGSIDVEVIDHIIINNGNVWSMRENNMIAGLW